VTVLKVRLLYNMSIAARKMAYIRRFFIKFHIQVLSSGITASRGISVCWFYTNFVHSCTNVSVSKGQTHAMEHNQIRCAKWSRLNDSVNCRVCRWLWISGGLSVSTGRHTLSCWNYILPRAPQRQVWRFRVMSNGTKCKGNQYNVCSPEAVQKCSSLNYLIILIQNLQYTNATWIQCI
jgi:hypothetical protein